MEKTVGRHGTFSEKDWCESFVYVHDQNFHAMLKGKLDEDTCSAAMDYATQCYMSSQLSELVDFRKTKVHAAALDAAEAFLMIRFYVGVLENLKLFWKSNYN